MCSISGIYMATQMETFIQVHTHIREIYTL